MGYRLQQKSTILNVNHSSVVSVMGNMTKRLRLESRGFRYKVALNLSHLDIKFDAEVRRKSLRISIIIRTNK